MLSTGDVGSALGVTINTVKNWILSGRIRGIRLPSGHYRIPRRELERLQHPRLGPEGLRRAWRKRARDWRRHEEWLASQPVADVPLHVLLGWVDQMLRFAETHGPLDQPLPEETAEGVARLHRTLVHVTG
jgi:excisionase family DNA binding protein